MMSNSSSPKAAESDTFSASPDHKASSAATAPVEEEVEAEGASKGCPGVRHISCKPASSDS